MSSTEDYPWLEPVWRQLRGTPDRLSHSLLVTGAAGLGKNGFARDLAMGLLCHEPDETGHACGQCKSCQLFAAGTHPDFLLTSPEEDSSIIAIDQVRAVIEYFSLRPHTSASKIAILTPAEAMNVNAANSLLKILEEPPEDAMLILVSSAPHRLPATIRSRCSLVRIDAPVAEMAQSWLAQRGIAPDLIDDLLASANGAPLLAQGLHEGGYLQARDMMLQDLVSLSGGKGDPVACAQRWKQLGAAFSLHWLGGLVADLVQLASLDAQHARLNNPSLRERLREMASSADPKRLLDLLQRTIESGNLAETPLDDTLLIEDILIGWSKTSS